MAEKVEIPQNLSVVKISLILGVIGLLISILGYFVDQGQFFHSYLVAFSFWITIGLGGLFLTLLHHLAGAVWSIVIRRLFETLAAILPWMMLFLIPVLLGMRELYHWTHPEIVAHDELLQMKTPYLNIPFFVIRAFLFAVIWTLTGRALYRFSIKNDESGDVLFLNKAKKLSPAGIILFALTLSFASFDWLMSLDAHWYSTIFGVYIFGGSTLAVYSFVALVTIYFDKKGPLKGLVSVEHYHDLGRLIFTFVVFWSYIAFSQYFLIWYANIPEETVWFSHRWVGSWKIVSVFLVIGQFIIPFFILMIRAMKRSLLMLTVMALWMLIMHYVDMYWLVMPTLHHEGVHLNWMDATTFIGVGGIFIWLFFTQLARHSLVPFNDPNLEKSIKHRM